MAAEGEAAKKEEEAEAKPKSPYALLVELEGAAVHARQAEYEALRSVLKDQKLEVPKSLFIRHCLNARPSAYVPALLDALGGKKQEVDDLVKEVKSGVTMYLSSPEATLNPIAEHLLAEAHKRHMEVALLTGEKESVAKSLVGRWGGDHGRIKVFTYEPGSRPFPRADVWLKMAKSIARTPRQCIALAGSSYSAKTALSAGMPCIALADEFTAFQDFGGTDTVLDADTEFDAAELLEVIAPVKPFI